MDDVVERYTAAALAGARTRAAGIAAAMAGVDPSPVRVIEELLAPSQRDVGERWQHLQCTVGEEHAATFVTESVLASISVGFEPEADRGTLVMACADGEWHGLPARMASELLIQNGWNVVYLGPATPAVQLRAYLAGIDVDAVCISATMTSNLPGAARSAGVARHLGMPVIVGGAAFGRDERRARAIGADGWAPNVRDGLDLPAALWDDPGQPDEAAEWAVLDDRRDRLVRDAVRHLEEDAPARSPSPSWSRQLAMYIDHLVGVVTAAVLCGDRTILDEHRAWLDDLVVSHAAPPEVSRYGYDAVRRAVAVEFPTAAEIIGGSR